MCSPVLCSLQEIINLLCLLHLFRLFQCFFGTSILELLHVVEWKHRCWMPEKWCPPWPWGTMIRDTKGQVPPSTWHRGTFVLVTNTFPLALCQFWFASCYGIGEGYPGPWWWWTGGAGGDCRVLWWPRALVDVGVGHVAGAGGDRVLVLTWGSLEKRRAKGCFGLEINLLATHQGRYWIRWCSYKFCTAPKYLLKYVSK